MPALNIIIVYSSSSRGRGPLTRITSAPCDPAVSSFLPENCRLLRRFAGDYIKKEERREAPRCTLHYAGLSVYYDSKGSHELSEDDVRKLLHGAGIRPAKAPDLPGDNSWLECRPETVLQAIESLRHGDIVNDKSNTTAGTKRKNHAKKTTTGRHKAADALDWKDANTLMRSLYEDGRYRDCLLVASGCYLGLRISDILTLRWNDILDRDTMSVTEKKTGKTRAFRLNEHYRKIVTGCYRHLSVSSDDAYVFTSGGTGGETPITRQRADQILKECKTRYAITSAKVFSTHSLRKTFGRRVWLRQCEKGQGDQALLLLCDVFGHSSIQITKRYLGIRQEEILSVYDTL